MDHVFNLLLFLYPFLVPLALLIGTYFIGSYIERRHYANVRAREEQYRSFPVVTFATLPGDWNVASTGFAKGSVVISVDYFKRFLAGLRGLIGGRIRSYEPLLDRARREAVLRMTEDAMTQGYDAVINARLETSRLASSRGDGKGTAGVEMLAYGTALKLAR
ncbi:MAG: YbjQ family protein [bacterium]|nr:YbjQ family protein [bacterium]